MNPTDHWDDLKSAGAVPPPSAEVLAHARRQLDEAAVRSRRTRTVRRRVFVPTLAATATAAAVIGGVAIHRGTSEPDPVAVPGPTSSAPRPSTTSPRPSTTSPRSSATSPRPSQGIAGSCAVGYSPAELKKRAFAFDGTVEKAVRAPDAAFPSYLLTFTVHEWFKPVGGGRTVTVRTATPPQGSGYQVSVDFPDYTVGRRLLIAGEPQWGGADPLKDPYAFGCGFSRAYAPGDAATWRTLLSK
ncbi:hypothetical protein [Kribbella sp. NPDC050459]|uniref:hypothetical protein n=1 Tax=Kribbella sp. NPDC050459 TaxID=3155785 RepID=UPI0033C4A515